MWVQLQDVQNADNYYEGRIFEDMLRIGVRLLVAGPKGCHTSTIQSISWQGDGQYLLKTRNTQYCLTATRHHSGNLAQAA